MPRRMNDEGDAFRAKITFKYWQDVPTTIYEGPYASVGSAKARITWATRIYGSRIIETSVEKAVTNWEKMP